MLQVYRHIYGNSVIYIGIGKPGRSKDKYNRNRQWLELVTDPHKLEVDILWETKSRKEAYTKEQEFIHLYGRKDLNEGTLVNKTNGGGWLQGTVWSEEKRKEYSERARKRANLAIYMKENGSPNKEKTLGPRPKHIVEKTAIALKKSWEERDPNIAKAQTRLFRKNNPSYKVKHCAYCDRDIQGASAYKRFHGNNCKSKN